ncbi:ATP-binding cassette domain-containing protein [Kibdelosporangium persicum]|uniref:ATPase component of ABC-type multidrug transport system n=1 Tax=Kibdelosporangium persicum TaxID=2698649 RepID=A0ABX2F4K8_9PSEU|nr:ATP-binding cassette domain-containing protein [Kibdelosporangium persicum]NRN66172.1 ATPase component of ABC-type multidrug transport system [Kibdelosporangium persicum]
MSDSTANAIEAEGLVKRFGETTALDGVDLEVPAGRILGVLGPNGAGKTTAVRILATLQLPDAGTARIGGYDVLRDPVAVRGLIGLTGQYASVDEDMSGRDNLVLFGRLLEMSKADARARARDLLDRFELSDAANRPVRTYSGGMRRRLDLSASLISRPRVLFLDEPTTGLDPHSRNEIWDIVRRLVDDGVTVLLTTQYLEEADQLADRITVFDHGRVVADGTPNELKRKVGGQTLQVKPSQWQDMDAVARILLDVTGARPLRDMDSRVLNTPVEDPVLLSTVVTRLAAAGIAVDELGLRLPSLDEVFLAITGSKQGVTA